MDERRAYLKQLAARSARGWGTAPLPECFAGETRIETRNTCYQLRDGVCYAVRRLESAGATRMHPSEFIGMRIVGWLTRDTPRQGITHAWQPGAYAVLWKPREGDAEHSAVALTSTSSAFRTVVRVTAPPPLLPQPAAARPARPSTPPPLPLAITRGALLPRPVTPPAWVPPPPPSMTRLHLNEIPPAPDTPTPLRRPSSVPPPLPPRARVRSPRAPRSPVFS
jgi:hypothetical protein